MLDTWQTRKAPSSSTDFKLFLLLLLFFLFPFLHLELLSSWISTCQILPIPSWSILDVVSMKPSLIPQPYAISSLKKVACDVTVRVLTLRQLREQDSRRLKGTAIPSHLLFTWNVVHSRITFGICILVYYLTFLTTVEDVWLRLAVY